MATRSSLLHSSIVAGVQMLEDPTQHVRCELVLGKSAGTLDLFYGLFPPKGLHPDALAPTFTFDVKLGVRYELAVMVNTVSTESGPYLAFGFLGHSCREALVAEAKEHGLTEEDTWISPEKSQIAIEGNFITRRGHIRMSTELYVLISAVLAERIELAAKKIQRHRTRLSR